MKKLLPVFFTIFTFLFFYSLNLTTSSVFAVVDPECKPNGVSPERDPRPASCNICNITDLLTPSCATSFEVFDEVTYHPLEAPIIKKDWEGEITVNPKEIKIPFVGMGNKEKEGFWDWLNFFDIPDENAKSFFAFWEVSNASENKYLADYFEGTNEYYRNYGNKNTITNYQGVLRKLTPYGYQNQLKKQLITRVNSNEEDQIHDYRIKYIGRFCWDFPFWLDAGHVVFEKLTNEAFFKPLNKILAFFWDKINLDQFADSPEFKLNIPDIGHYCLYASLQEGPAGWFLVKGNEIVTDVPIIGEIKEALIKLSQIIPGVVHFSEGETVNEALSALKDHLPPDPNDENYREKFLIWKMEDGGKWYRLWQATPMLSREDTLGEINPYLAKEHKEDSNLEFKSEEAKLESVPHLARLYEGSQIISNILTPAGEKKIEMVKSEPIPETTPPNACFKENYILTDEGDSLCCEPIKATFLAVEEFENLLYEKCQSASPSASCYELAKKDVSRGFGVNLKHPYLDEIWSFTTNSKGGFFNIFRPQNVPAFEDIDAAQTISYAFSSGEVAPEQGLFFFPHLGGVQKAKEWVVNQALWPHKKQ